MISLEVSKLIVDEGQFYIVYNIYGGFFVSPPIMGHEEFIDYVDKSIGQTFLTPPSIAEWLVMAANIEGEFNVTGEKVRLAKSAIEILCQGQTPSADLVRCLGDFNDVLHAVVPARYWYSYERFIWIENLIKEYGVRTPDLQGRGPGDIIDHCNSALFPSDWESRDQVEVLTSPKCRLLGDYFAKYLEMSHLAISNPLEVIQASVRNEQGT